MDYGKLTIEELKILSLYNLSSIQEGIKVHGSATEESISAAKKLFEKGDKIEFGYKGDIKIKDFLSISKNVKFVIVTRANLEYRFSIDSTKFGYYNICQQS